jgi:hypothetical protein
MPAGVRLALSKIALPCFYHCPFLALICDYLHVTGNVGLRKVAGLVGSGNTTGVAPGALSGRGRGQWVEVFLGAFPRAYWPHQSLDLPGQRRVPLIE